MRLTDHKPVFPVMPTIEAKNSEEAWEKQSSPDGAHGVSAEELVAGAKIDFFGLERRDFFAAIAMHALVSSGGQAKLEATAIEGDAYRIADAMEAGADKK